MKIKRILIGLLSTSLLLACNSSESTPVNLDVDDSVIPSITKPEQELNQYTKAFRLDINTFCDLIREKYYYFDKAEDSWSDACEQARQSVLNVKDNWEGLAALEFLSDQLYESHLGFNKNLRNSPRLLPSGADLWVEQGSNGNGFIISAVRFAGGAAKAGIQIGDEFISLNAMSSDELIQSRIQLGFSDAPIERKHWALNAALAGNRNEPREFIVKRQNELLNFSLATPEPQQEPGTVQHKLLNENIAYVRFSNSLGNSQAVEDFSNTVKELKGAKAWILDLRNTNGGGGTGVAEPIMGHFFTQETLYQKTVYKNGEIYLPKIIPNKNSQITAPLVVLVGRWTGSMGEGMAIGFDGAKRGTVIGTKMGRLAGGTEGFQLEQTNTGVSFPTYDLRHLDGTPRHLWEPNIQVSSDNGNEKDLALEKALQIIKNLNL